MNKYTINQWRKDGEFKAQRFQEIDKSIYYRFLESVPPMKQSSNAFISGGAYGYDYENGKNLYIVNSHMSAYDKGGVIRAKQLELLNKTMQQEYNKGNYVI